MIKLYLESYDHIPDHLGFSYIIIYELYSFVFYI